MRGAIKLEAFLIRGRHFLSSVACMSAYAWSRGSGDLLLLR